MLSTFKNDLVYISKSRNPNPNFGKSVIAFPEDYVVLDLETTGLDPAHDLIIEFAAIKVRGGQVIDVFQTLCDPGFPIPPQIEAITGISSEMVRFSPNPRQVLPDFLDFVGDGFIMGHNVLFDIRFIAASSGEFTNPYIDTMKLFRKLHPGLPHHRLCDMVDFYGKRNETAHRALSDCSATNDCFKAMTEEIENHFKSTENYLKILK